MAGEVTRTVRIVYEVDGVEQATADQQSLAGAIEQTGQALNEQTGAVENAEQAIESLSDVATRSEQVTQRLHQSLTSLAGGLQQVSSLMGQESDGGRVVGQMSRFAATGIQLGSAFGPLGGALGGVTGALLGLGEALTPVVPAIREVTDEAESAADAAIRMGESFDGAGDRMRAFLDDVSTSSRTRALGDLNARITEMSDRLVTLRNGSAMERLEALSLQEELSRLTATSAETQAGLDAEGRETGGGRRGGGRGRGGSRAPAFRSDNGAALRALAGGGGDDAIGFASGLGADRAAGEREKAQEREDAEKRAQRDLLARQMQTLDRIGREQERLHDEQMARIEQQVEAWTGAGQKIGSTLYNAFQTAATGQESLDVAVVKGFKGLAIQFGGQMVNEGIAALLTAAGNTVANPPMAATKAAEGAGKLALGIGLGAAGAAIPVPSSGAQARTPRLGPPTAAEGSGAGVVVNMNAPSVVTGSGSQVGRLIGRSLDDARQRFGRAA